MNIRKPKGTFDILPSDAFKRNFIYGEIRRIFDAFNYREILTPVFEKTELFKRGIGEETDIVSKEMYSFKDNEFTLRPEMTASVIRSYLENSLYNEAPLTKLYYIANMFRSERPQAGRYREFWQFGAEAIGDGDYTLDAEMISASVMILERFNIPDISVKINNIGTQEERDKFLIELKSYLGKYTDDLSEESRRRLEKNPLRILDTKDPKEIEILQDAPLLYDFLEEETKNEFNLLLDTLKNMGIKYDVDYRLVRGFDYYTSTTFEVHSDALGAQSAVLGGGRYDLLVQELGGKPTPAIGFASGLERLMMVIGAGGFAYPAENPLQLYVVTFGDKAKSFARTALYELRKAGIKCDTDYLNRSIKAQMKEANRMNAEYVMVVGDSEIDAGNANLKKMSDGSEELLSLSHSDLVNKIKSL